jgi:hypothetical protein
MKWKAALAFEIRVLTSTVSSRSFEIMDPKYRKVLQDEINRLSETSKDKSSSTEEFALSVLPVDTTLTCMNSVFDLI